MCVEEWERVPKNRRYTFYIAPDQRQAPFVCQRVNLVARRTYRLMHASTARAQFRVGAGVARKLRDAAERCRVSVSFTSHAKKRRQQRDSRPSGAMPRPNSPDPGRKHAHCCVRTSVRLGDNVACAQAYRRTSLHSLRHDCPIWVGGDAYSLFLLPMRWGRTIIAIGTRG
jgi:hypothetical protein